MNTATAASMGIAHTIGENIPTILELELHGNIRFEQLIQTISHHLKTPFKVLKANINNHGKASFGTIKLQLTANKKELEHTLRYFKLNNIKNVILD